MSSPDVHVPGPSDAEQELQKQQAELLGLQQQVISDQRQQNKVLMPIVGQEMGFDIETDDRGNITSIEELPDPMGEQRERIQQQMLDRTEAALAGDLPVDPGLERALGQQEEQMEERLSEQFGPGFETASPAIETMGDFFTQSEILRHGARTADLTLAEQLSLAREQQGMVQQQQQLDTVRQFGIQDPMAMAGGFGQTAQGVGQALQNHPSRHHRQMQTQANMAEMQASTQLMGAGIGAVGALFSDDDGKVVGSAISHTGEGIPIYLYNRTDDAELYIGVLASDVEKVRPGAVYERLGARTVQYEDVS